MVFSGRAREGLDRVEGGEIGQERGGHGRTHCWELGAGVKLDNKSSQSCETKLSKTYQLFPASYLLDRDYLTT